MSQRVARVLLVLIVGAAPVLGQRDLAAARRLCDAGMLDEALVMLGALVEVADPVDAARALRLRVRCREKQEQLAAAIDDQRRVVELVRKLDTAPEDLIPAQMLWALSRLEAEAERWTDYLATNRELLGVLLALGSERIPEAATIQGNVGFGLTKLDRQAEAEVEFRAAAALVERHVGTRTHAFIALMHSNIGFSLRERQRFDDALREFDAAVAIYEACDDVPLDDLVAAISNRAYGLASLSRLAESKVEFERAFQLVRDAPDAPRQLLAHALYNLANAALDVGDDHAAVAHFEHSIAVLDAMEPRPTAALVDHLDRLARCHDGAGRPWDAIPSFRRSLDLATAYFGTDHVRTLAIQVRCGGALGGAGRTHDAMQTYAQALARMRAAPAPAPAIADLLSRMGYLLRDQAGMDRESLPLFEEAFSLWRDHGGERADMVRALNNLAACHQSLGDHARAIPLFEQALELLQGDDTSDARPHLHSNLGYCMHKVGRIDEARPHLEQAVALGRATGSTSLPVWLSNLAYLESRSEDRLETARALFSEAVEGIEQQRQSARALDDRDRMRLFHEQKRGGAHDGLIAVSLRLGRVDEALTTLERSRGRGLLDLLERSRFDVLEQVESAARQRGEEDLLRRIVELRQRLATIGKQESALTHELAAVRANRHLDLDARTASRDRLGSELEVVRSRLAEANRERALLEQSEIVLATPHSAARIQALLRGAERMAVYCWGDAGKLRLFFVRPAGQTIDVHDLPATRAQVTRLCAEIAGGGVDASRGQDPDTASTGERASDESLELFHALVPDRLLPELRLATRLFVIPDGPLHALPFEALVTSITDGRATRWLHSECPIVYGPSASFFVWLAERGRSRAKYRAGHVVVAVGDPQFAGDRREPAPTRDGYGELSRLPGSAVEVRRVCDMFPAELAPLALTGAAATETAVWERAPKARFLHFATHGLRDEAGDALFDALALAHPEHSSATDDGFLKLSDLLMRWRDRLTSCEMVVLSACDTHARAATNDEGVFTLPWGFFFAGARSVLATRWRVDDTAAAELMMELYRRVGEGEDPAIALVAAKRLVARSRPDPRFWAPFMTLGGRFE